MGSDIVQLTVNDPLLNVDTDVIFGGLDGNPKHILRHTYYIVHYMFVSYICMYEYAIYIYIYIYIYREREREREREL